jgi:DNA-binding MarR family transcriptional regulator
MKQKDSTLLAEPALAKVHRSKRPPQNRDQGRSPFRHVPAYLARRFQLICTAIVAEAVDGAGLSMPQWVMLAHIDEMPEVDQSRLALTTSIDKTNTGRLVDQLEAMGLIQRRPDSADRRAWRLSVTPRGRDLRRKLRPQATASQDKLLSCLSPTEQKIFVQLLTRVVDANEDYVRPGAGRKPRARSPSK